MSKELEDLRKYAEEDCVVVTVVSRDDAGYKTVYSIVNFDGKYILMRYFKIGEDWQWSQDKESKSLEDCLKFLESEFADLYPRD